MSTERDLEKEYDPTQWTKRFECSKELLINHVAFGNRGNYSSIIVPVN